MKQHILHAMQKCIDENQYIIDDVSDHDQTDDRQISNLLMIQKGMLEMQIAVLKAMIGSD